ncbi:MAG TPA: MerR family DNA-binding transcriptional regulator [Casimicrobium sp.]|nr:MerR family DNA-binding transcriptional regulator [Casimicrobium sp.]
MRQNNPLTTSGVARETGIAESTVRALERRGVIPAVRDSSGRRIFDRNVLPVIRDYLQNRR